MQPSKQHLHKHLKNISTYKKTSHCTLVGGTKNIIHNEYSNCNDDSCETQKDFQQIGSNYEIGYSEQPSHISVSQIIDTSEEPPQFQQSEQMSYKTFQSSNISKQVTAEPKPLEFAYPSKPVLYTIPAGVVLYHGSQTVDTFEVETLNLKENTNVVFFSPNYDVAKSYIQYCSPANPVGFIHKFTVIKPIDKIFIISANETDDIWQEPLIEEKFCNNTKHDSCHADLHGIGFFIELKDGFNAEFALCRPAEFLQYEGRSRCNGARVLTDNFEKF